MLFVSASTAAAGSKRHALAFILTFDSKILKIDAPDAPDCHSSAMVRNQDHPANLKAEIGSVTILSYLDPNNKFCPFNPQEPTREHWKSNEVFQKCSYAIWEALARNLKQNACDILNGDPHNRRLKIAQLKGTSQSGLSTSNVNATVASLPTKSTIQTPKAAAQPSNMVTSPPMSAKKKKAVVLSPSKVKNSKHPNEKTVGGTKSNMVVDEFDEILWVEYPDREIFMQIDLDGDILDPAAHRIEFSTCGTVVTYSSRIPEMMLDASKILTNVREKDAFKYLLNVEVKKRKEKLQTNEDGGPIFQVRKSVTLPYPVQKMFFDENYKEMETYKLMHSAEGCGYTFFWLLPTIV